MTHLSQQNTGYSGSIFFLKMFLFVLCLFSASSLSASQENGVVIVTSNNSSIEKISVMEVRRLYLGLPPVNNRNVGKAVINLENRDTYNTFLKNIMHMTEYRYKRRLVKRVFRYGTSTIKEVSQLSEISDHLERNINDITFVESSRVDQIKNARIILRLW